MNATLVECAMNAVFYDTITLILLLEHVTLNQSQP